MRARTHSHRLARANTHRPGRLLLIGQWHHVRVVGIAPAPITRTPLPHPAEPHVSIQHIVAASDRKRLALAPSFSLSLSLRRGRKLIESDGFPRLLACGLLTEQDRRKGRCNEWEGERTGVGREKERILALWWWGVFFVCFFVSFCDTAENIVLS